MCLKIISKYIFIQDGENDISEAISPKDKSGKKKGKTTKKGDEKKREDYQQGGGKKDTPPPIQSQSNVLPVAMEGKKSSTIYRYTVYTPENI